MVPSSRYRFSRYRRVTLSARYAAFRRSRAVSGSSSVTTARDAKYRYRRRSPARAPARRD